MASPQHILIEVPGATLEAQLVKKEAKDCVGVLVLHPYALLGGSMFDPVVSEVFRQAAASPAFACVLRYNLRGVGRSSGSRSLLGKADGPDVEALCEFLLGQLSGSNRRVFVVGYSYGACLATRALCCPRVAAYAGISFPLGGLALLLQPRKHFAALCAAGHVPRLLVIGTQDQYAKHTAMLQLVRQHGGCMYDTWAAAATAATQAEELELRPDQRQGEHETAGSGGSQTGSQAGQAAAGEQQGHGGSSPAGGPLAAGPAAPAPLLLRVYQQCDHFWMEEGPRMASGVVWWLEIVARSQAA